MIIEEIKSLLLPRHNLFGQESLYDVAFLEFLKIFKADTALIFFSDFVDIVFEMFKRGNSAFMDNLSVPDNSGFCISSYYSISNVAASNDSNL